MALYSFCGLLTLQVGVAILAAVFFAIAGAILAANVFDYHSDHGLVPLILMLIFVIGLIVAGVFMFASSYIESRGLAVAALIVIIILIVYWLILCAFSFLSNPDHVHGICINTRCPESFWIGNLGYRRMHIDEEEGGKGGGGGKEGGGGDKSNQESPKRRRALESQNWIETRKKRMEPSIQVLYANISTIEDNAIKGKENEFLNQMSNRNERVHPFDDNEKAVRKKNITRGFGEQIRSNRGGFENKDRTYFGSHQNLADAPVIVKPDYRRLGDQDAEVENAWLNDEPTEKQKENVAEETTPKSGKKGSKEKENEDGESRYVFGLPLVGAIILFILNLLFLLYTALVVYSWANELNWAEYYEEDDPVVIVEDY